MHLDLASGWQLQIAIERDQLGALLWALAPDGRDWEHGCQRDDWTLGPDSQIVEPLGLLTLEQQEQLACLLRTACCWPPPHERCDGAIQISELKVSRWHGKGRRRPSQWQSRGRCDGATSRCGSGSAPLLKFRIGNAPLRFHNRNPTLSLSLMARPLP